MADMTAVALQSRQTTRLSTGRATLWLIAAIPALFAVTTWSHDAPAHDLKSLVRYFSLPVIAVEALVFFYALATGADVVQRMLSLPRWLLAALVALAAIAIGTNALVAVEPGIGGITASFWFLHVGFGVSVAVLAEKHWHADAATIWTPVVLGLLAYLAIAAAFVASNAHAESFDWIAFNLGAINIRHTAPYAIIGFTGSLMLALTAPAPRRARLTTLSALLFAAFIFWSGTRAALFALIATLLLGMPLFATLRTARALRVLAVSVIGGALLSLLHAVPSPSFGLLTGLARSTPANDADASSGRLDIWKGTIAAIGERPFFGHGDSQLSHVVPAAKDLFNHPHNSVLQFAFMWGIIGATLFFAVFATLWVRMTRRARHRPTAHLAAWLVVTGIAALSLLDGSLYFPYPVMMIAFAFGISEGMPRRGVTESG